MITNPNGEVFDLFPTALYASNYKEDITSVTDYFTTYEK